MSDRIIILNGASSSGKTSIAKEILKITKGSFLYLSLDEYIMNASKGLKAFFPMLSTLDEKQNDIYSQYMSLSILDLFHRSIFALYKSGNNVIVDTVFQEKEWLDGCVKIFENENVIFVGLLCSLDELERRERSRCDRKNGLAKYQYDRVHRGCIYDIELDTGTKMIDECAKIIISTRVGNGFRKMKEISIKN